MLVALHRGRGFIAKAIQWQTRSAYSHASVVFEGSGVVIEAREFKGVRSILWDEVVAKGEQVDVFRVKGLVPEAEGAVWEFLQAQLGKPYDYTMVARFITRRQGAREESGKWFCSELVFAALAKAGVRLLERIEPWAVSPGVLSLSTRLEEVRGGKWEGRGGGLMGNVQLSTFNFQRSEEGIAAGNAKGAERGIAEGKISDLRFEISKMEKVGRGGVSMSPGLVNESAQVGKGSTESRPTERGEQAGTPAVSQAEGLRYGEEKAGEGTCPTTEGAQVNWVENSQSTIANSQGGGL